MKFSLFEEIFPLILYGESHCEVIGNPSVLELGQLLNPTPIRGMLPAAAHQQIKMKPSLILTNMRKTV